MIKRIRTDAVVPMTDFRASSPKYLRMLDEGPVVITLDGRPGAILLSPAEYDDLVMWASVGHGMVDVREGRAVPHEEAKKVFAEARAKRPQPTTQETEGSKKRAAK